LLLHQQHEFYTKSTATTTAKARPATLRNQTMKAWS
jgi:hypothetical protein